MSPKESDDIEARKVPAAGDYHPNFREPNAIFAPRPKLPQNSALSTADAAAT
jgi:hypothetical protein